MPRLAPEELGPGDLVLLDERLGPDAVPTGVVTRRVAFAGHAAACACCGGRSPLAGMLARLVVERARGEVPFFGRVVAVSDAGGRAALRDLVRADMLVGSRYVVG